jgi:hypothetical protein
VFYSEQEAHAYRESLEQDETRRHAQAAERF